MLPDVARMHLVADAVIGDFAPMGRVGYSIRPFCVLVRLPTRFAVIPCTFHP